ncbi:histidine kinase [Flavobacteriales bacterium 33_180_T64]|nr:histidine kinase [Flavobacteriales bacterium 33_180_T64]
MSQDELEILKRALIREKQSRKAVENSLEKKSTELSNVILQLKESNGNLENLLDEKKTELQGVFENINDAYIVIALNGNVLRMNNAAVDLFGYDIEKEKFNVTKLIYKEDEAYTLKSFKKLKEKGTFVDYTARVFTKQEKVRWVHINASVIYDKHQTPVAAQGIIKDITDAMRKTALIEEQKKELDVIVQNSSLGIVLTQSGRIIRTNQAIQRILGYSDEELSTLTIKDVSFEEDFHESKEYLERMDSGEIENFVINKRYRKKDGSVLWAKTNVNVVRDFIGNIKYQVALIEDVTFERERSLIINVINDIAKAILGKMNIYEIAWEITNSIAQYLGTQDCVIYLVDYKSDTLEQIAAFGEKLDKEKHIANKIILPIGKGIVGHVVLTGKSEIIGNTSKDERYVIDDKERLSEITVPIISEGVVIGIIDCEHESKNYFRKEHLTTLESIANLVAMQLKSAINIRERENAEAKNILLLNELGKSNDELQEYAHIISHDLKSPLRSIDALVSWIKEDNKGKLDEVSLQNFAHIENTLEKMERLISDVLTYSSTGANNLEKVDVDINELVHDLVDILYIPEHIEVKLLNTLPIIKGDKTKLHQLFQNLISNAVKFIDKEHGKIEIDVIEDTEFFKFSIKDNGIGVDKKFHNKIFKIFHTLKSSKKSSGIGLSIVKKVVNLHGGKVWLDSEIGKGTTFYFTLKK